MHVRPWLLVASTVLAAAAGLLSGCHRSTAGTVRAGGCAPAINERLDPRSSIHLFTSAKEPSYLTDPPTSGPHRLGPPFLGVVTTPISRPSQVAMLESGFVLLQSQGLSASDTATLDRLIGNLVTVAPPAGRLPSPVVATAWTWKLECGSAGPHAIAAIGAFITAHQGVGFSGKIPGSPPGS